MFCLTYILLLLCFILFDFFQFSLSDYPDVPFDLKNEPRKYIMKSILHFFISIQLQCDIIKSSYCWLRFLKFVNYKSFYRFLTIKLFLCLYSTTLKRIVSFISIFFLVSRSLFLFRITLCILIVTVLESLHNHHPR